MAMKCEKCQSEIDPNSVGWAQRVEGWELRRRQGGTNAIMDPRRLQRWLCNMCVVRLKTIKHSEEQGTLM